ncbi:GIY-YIG nuclease family protein [Paenibacillus polysaccharolyticus]|uniref:GIY-YIG nuclease family protein n=1 Tax=Paenibacillus polysaccharolyticus TaxID=582692 RepID=UPI002040B6CD|nr:GIY-YIG nuclease family protein [Paenibacillus polysaccharolyticus]MCM3131879.1 GIY-YIG nuclease family protein [Paenibacillus polysaccharolyticus]
MNFSSPQIFTDWSNVFTPETGGVYMLLSNPSGRKYSVLYVGQSNNLRRRINEHLQDSQSHFKGKIMNFVYLTENNKLKRDSIESNLVKNYNPKFNILLKSVLQEDSLGNLIRTMIKNQEKEEKEKQERIRGLLLYLSK